MPAVGADSLGGTINLGTMKPFCFVLMPFGTKTDEGGRAIDFDRVYSEVIQPAIVDAEMEPVRADGEGVGGIIHKPMFERLMLCDYAVADLTTANPNVLYELGIRHGIRPYSTVLIFGKGMRLPFDIALLRGLPDNLDKSGAPETPSGDRKALADRLAACRTPAPDSPLFQLLSDYSPPDIAHVKTDVFRDAVEYSQRYKDKLRAARSAGRAAVAEVERELNIADADPAIAIDLYLSYRAVKDWQAMLDLEAKMSPILRSTVMVQEQLGFALNRLGRRDDAERILLAVMEQHGPSSETNGLLGRVYKDAWEDARNKGQDLLARGHLRKAIGAYLAGFEADWRDSYPGVNTVTLMEMQEPVDPRQARLLPVVRYAIERRMAAKTPDYWDFATVVELEVLAGNRDGAEAALGDALAVVREAWEPETTARNLRLIREAREKRKIDVGWIADVEAELGRAAAAK
jgi:tetratricopeptide (TPR) repeat protein